VTFVDAFGFCFASFGFSDLCFGGSTFSSSSGGTGAEAVSLFAAAGTKNAEEIHPVFPVA
jgi:hypothetical protein